MANEINLGLTADATGTVDAITATYNPAPTLANRKKLWLVSLGANTITGVTFSPNGLTVKPVTARGGQTIRVGDTGIAGYVMSIQYSTSGGGRWELLNPATVSKADVGLGNVDNTSDANKPVSTAQAAADASTLSSANAYSDSLVIGLWDDRGNFNASVNAYPSSGGSGSAGAILKGDTWTISVGGTLPTSQVVEVGDVVRALINTPGNTQANWAIQQNNIGYTAENSANKASTITASATQYPNNNAVIAYAAPLASQLKATALKNSAYVAVPGDYIPVDTTSGVVNITLPTAPVDGTIIAIKRVVGPTNNVTYTCGGSDTLNLSAGSTSGSLQILNQQVTLIYRTTGGIWYVETSISLGGLDARYVPLTTGVRIIGKTTTDSTNITGTTTNTITYSLLIPANTLVVGDTPRFSLRMRFVGITAGKTIRVYTNTSASLSGATLCATIPAAIGNLSVDSSRMFAIKSTTNSEFYSSAASSFTGDVQASASVSTNSIDWTVDQYFIVAIQLGNSADAGLLSYFKLTN